MDMAAQLRGGGPPAGADQVRQQIMQIYGVDPQGMSADQVMALINTPPPTHDESLGAPSAQALPQPQEPELRSANTPVGDAVAQSFGPEFGPAASAADSVTSNPFVEGVGDAVSDAAPTMSKALIGGSAMGLTAASAGDEASDDVVPTSGGSMSNSLRYEKFSNGRSGHRDVATGRFTGKPK